MTIQHRHDQTMLLAGRHVEVCSERLYHYSTPVGWTVRIDGTVFYFSPAEKREAAVDAATHLYGTMYGRIAQQQPIPELEDFRARQDGLKPKADDDEVPF